MAKKKILILYTKAGGGHESLASGLKERVEHELDAEVILVDPLSSILEYVYKATTIITPKTFNLLADFAENRFTSSVLKKINNVANIRVRRSLTELQPDLIISTHFFLVNNIAGSIKHSDKKIPLAVYIADPFFIHPLWFSKDVDQYFAFDETYLPPQFEKYFKNKTISIGMPLRKAFYKKFSKEDVFRELGFDVKQPTVMFGGSGAGMDNLERFIPRLLSLKENFPIQAIFVCGRNRILEKTLRQLFKKDEKIRIFSYVSEDKVAQFLQSSDIFVGKMGPNIMFEAMLSSTPVIATPPILIQEKPNREFIVDKQVGIAVHGTGEALTTLMDLLRDKKTIDQMKKNAQKVRDYTTGLENTGVPEMIHWIERSIA